MISHHNTLYNGGLEKAGHQFSIICRMEKSSEMDDRMPGVEWWKWTEGIRVQMTKEDLQAGRFQDVMEHQVTLALI